MAIIGEIRKRPTLIMVLLGLALLSFILADQFNNFFGPGVENAKTVLLNGEQIDEERFVLLNELENFYKVSGESQAINNQRDHGLAEERSERIQAWDRFARLVMIQEQNKEIGIETTEGELQLLFYQGDSSQISDWLRNKPFVDYWPIRNNQDRPEFQGYSPEYGRQMMGDPRTQYMVSQFRLEQKYSELLSAGFYATSFEAKKDAERASNSKSIQFVYKPYSDLSDSTYMPTDEEVKAYYKKHKNDPKYRDTPGRLVEVAQFVMPATDEDKAAIMKSAENLVNSFSKEENDLSMIASSSDSFDPKTSMERNPPIVQVVDSNSVPEQYADAVFGQDSVGVFGPYEENGFYRLMKIRNEYPRRARHILFTKDGQNANNEQLADSIIKALQADTTGFLFDQLARKYSEGPSSVSGGDLGYFDYKQMVFPFANAVYNLDSGKIGAVYSEFGLHIIEVTGIADTGMFKLASYLDKRIKPHHNTIRSYNNEARNIGSNVINGDGEFKDVADSMGFAVQELRVDENSAVIPGFPNSQMVYDFVMSGVYDDISSPIIIEDKIYVLRIKKVYKKGPKDEEDTFESMKRDLMNEKKAEAYRVMIANAGSLEKVAEKWNVDIKNDQIRFSDSRIDGGGTNDAVVIGALFGNHDENTVLDPMNGAQGVYVVTIMGTTNPEPGDVAVNQKNLSSQYANLMYGRNRDSGLLRAFKEFITIEDNR